METKTSINNKTANSVQGAVSCWHGQFSRMFNRSTKEKFLK